MKIICIQSFFCIIRQELHYPNETTRQQNRIHYVDKLNLQMGFRLIVGFLAIVSFAICTSSAGGLNVIGDDELVEQINSNDFLIVLFSKFDQIILV